MSRLDDEQPRFQRLITRLFPRSEAWRVSLETALRKLVAGFSWLPAAARIFVDRIYLQLSPSGMDARTLPDWERQFGINFPSTDEATRRLAIASKWAAMGGQSPRYIEDVLRGAGFDVYVHECWQLPSAPPRTPHDPRDYAEDPLISTYQCLDDDDDPHECIDTRSGPQCTDWLVNEVNYIVNDSLTPHAPPPIPDDPARFPYFVYIGGETFPETATVPLARRTEFRELILSIVPVRHWIITLVEYDPGATYLVTDGGDFLVTDDGDYLVA